MEHRNLHEALPSELRDLFLYGRVQPSRDGSTVERTAHVITLTDPLERVQLQPHRNANIFAQIAETVWVLAGRKDIGWLSYYLPRAQQFSDDGVVWRAGYGPRLRHYAGRLNSNFTLTGLPIDQIAEVAHLLQRERGTRRAVVGIWEPASDLGVDSKDIPCNDTLQFLERDGALDLHVFVRSNDAWWGWSGINAFEWSVLLELMAFWTGARPGRIHTFVGSWHLYERHWQRANALCSAPPEPSPYVVDPGLLARSPRWATPLDQLDDQLDEFFLVESDLREGVYETACWAHVTDPFLEHALRLLGIYIRTRSGATSEETRQAMNELPDSDLKLAAAEWLVREELRHAAS